MQVRFARSARKHRVTRARILHVMQQSRLRFEQPPPPGAPAGHTVRFVYLGDDASGIALEVLAIELSGGDLLVIHAMLLREKYRVQYEEAKKWLT